MSSKKRKWLDEYIQYGFTCIKEQRKYVLKKSYFIFPITKGSVNALMKLAGFSNSNKVKNHCTRICRSQPRNIHHVQTWFPYFDKSLDIVMEGRSQFFQREYSQCFLVTIVHCRSVLRNPKSENSRPCYIKEDSNQSCIVAVPRTIHFSPQNALKGRSLEIISNLISHFPPESLDLYTFPEHMCVCAYFWVTCIAFRGAQTELTPEQ